MNNRLLDILFAVIGLLLFLPLIAIIWILIRVIMNDGPAIFQQRRVGKDGRIFTMYKFRTMTIEHSGSSVSVKGENRITPLGARLRKYKLDELPELINVILGDMTFVGPRPDVPGYMDILEGEDRKILKLRPGITGPASLKYINEEELLTKADDPMKYNNEVIFPDKVRINLRYLEKKSLLHDIKIIFYTVFRKKWNEY